jgi:hypothetical protein
MFHGVIDCFEEGWGYMEKCIKKFIEALPNNPADLDVKDCSLMYTYVFFFHWGIFLGGFFGVPI